MIMVNHITNEQIEILASSIGVKRIAVQNFLFTLKGLTYQEALSNLGLDKRLYKWNTATVNAIKIGIDTYFAVDLPNL